MMSPLSWSRFLHCSETIAKKAASLRTFIHRIGIEARPGYIFPTSSFFRGENLGISGNTNAALEMAEGDFVVLADHDDRLTPNALFECAKKLNENRTCDVLYSDEDKLDMDGDELFDPHFKPDFNPDLLTSVNYICHLFVVKKELIDKVGGFRAEYDGAQDYDFIFRCTENAEKICHIPKVLYHWRCHPFFTRLQKSE